MTHASTSASGTPEAPVTAQRAPHSPGSPAAPRYLLCLRQQQQFQTRLAPVPRDPSGP